MEQPDLLNRSLGRARGECAACWPSGSACKYMQLTSNSTLGSTKACDRFRHITDVPVLAEMQGCVRLWWQHQQALQPAVTRRAGKFVAQESTRTFSLQTLLSGLVCAYDEDSACPSVAVP